MWPFGKKQRETKSDVRSLIIDDLAGDFLGCALMGENITPQKAFKFYRQNSSVATAVDMVSEAFEQIAPIVQETDGTIQEQHPVLDLLSNPNPYMTWSDLATRLAHHYLLTNETHMYAVGTNTVAPVEVYPVKPTAVNPVTGTEYVKDFYVGAGVASGRFTEEIAAQRISRYYAGPMRELYRIAGFSSMPTDGRPDSPLQAAALEANQQTKGRIHNLKVLDNGGRMSLLVIFKEEHTITDDEHKERTQAINETFAGPQNAGRIGVMSGGDIQSVEEMGNTNKDMDYANLDEIAGRAIYQRYKIPLPLVTTSASTFNNMQTGVEMLYDFAVLPLADKIFSGISRFLLPRFGMELNQYKITFNPESLQALKARRIAELKTRSEIGVETIDELREAIPNRGPIAGGDTLYQSATLIPVGMDINEAGNESE